MLTVLTGVKSCKRGVSREHFRKFPVKSVKFASSKDFRFQDFTKDFSNELRDFKLVADLSRKGDIIERLIGMARIGAIKKRAEREEEGDEITITYLTEEVKGALPPFSNVVDCPGANRWVVY